MGKWHFWTTFLGAYSIYFPMHYLGFIGVPRRYFEMYDSPYMTSAVGMNEFISLAAFLVGAAQFIFFYNLVKSLRLGKKAPKNPWKANSLEWLTPDVPPTHGNWGKNLPVVHRWAMIMVYLEQKKIIFLKQLHQAKSWMQKQKKLNIINVRS